MSHYKRTLTIRQATRVEVVGRLCAQLRIHVNLYFLVISRCSNTDSALGFSVPATAFVLTIKATSLIRVCAVFPYALSGFELI